MTSEQHENMDQIIEAALFSAGEPLTAGRLQQMFAWAGRPSIDDIKAAITRITEAAEERGVELVEIASGYRFQAKAEYAEFLQRLWEKKPPKYSRAFMETLALVVYRQPITRGEIEDVRGVAVSSHIMKTLQDREWVKVVGTKDVPGKPALFGSTKQFLDDFNLKSLSELPPLDEIMNVEALEEKLGMQFNLEDAQDKESTEASEDEAQETVGDTEQDHDAEQAADDAANEADSITANASEQGQTVDQDELTSMDTDAPKQDQDAWEDLEDDTEETEENRLEEIHA